MLGAGHAADDRIEVRHELQPDRFTIAYSEYLHQGVVIFRAQCYQDVLDRELVDHPGKGGDGSYGRVRSSSE